MPKEPGYFDPVNGLGSWVDEFGTTQTGYVTDYTHGLLSYDAFVGRLFDPTKGDLGWSLGQQGLIQVSEYPDNTFTVISQTLSRQVNQYAGPEAIRIMGGTMTSVIEGETVTLALEPYQIAAKGRQWVAYPTATGELAYQQYTGPIRSNAEAAIVSGFAGARLATPSEAAKWGTIYSLKTYQKELLRDIANRLDLRRDDGSLDTSAAALAVYESGSLADLRVYSSVILTQG